jgi:hypothetical protein
MFTGEALVEKRPDRESLPIAGGCSSKIGRLVSGLFGLSLESGSAGGAAHRLEAKGYV